MIKNVNEWQCIGKINQEQFWFDGDYKKVHQWQRPARACQKEGFSQRRWDTWSRKSKDRWMNHECGFQNNVNMGKMVWQVKKNGVHGQVLGNQKRSIKSKSVVESGKKLYLGMIQDQGKFNNYSKNGCENPNGKREGHNGKLVKEVVTLSDEDPPY
ncbi:hypothetical protein AMTR_s00943p00010740 [Amborella trichopoda]|uniref:Uncharacterized protein n=1 Tax=Amborella trichopoda TaxID=13333 RepID=U5CM18_AMBTC|nr:hypothetical protein AMTR_s00943p00010740 [Amborella trichopoda]